MQEGLHRGQRLRPLGQLHEMVLLLLGQPVRLGIGIDVALADGHAILRGTLRVFGHEELGRGSRFDAGQLLIDRLGAFGD